MRERLLKRLAWERRRLSQRRLRRHQRRFMAKLPPSVKLGADAQLQPTCTIDAVELEIGAGTHVNHGCCLKGRAPIRIGNYCALGEGVRLISDNHEVNRANLQVALQKKIGAGPLVEVRGPIEVGHNVWIGDGAILVSGATVGNGAVIGAGAVVTGEIPPFAVAVGCPARPIRRRFPDEIVAQLLELAWWHWPIERIRSEREFFAADLSGEDAIATLARVRGDAPVGA